MEPNLTQPPEPLPQSEPPKEFGWPFWLTLIAVIALLAVIAVPHFVKARTTACKNSCLANLKQIDGAVQQWALENKKRGTDMVTTTDVLDYLKGSQLPACPEAGTYSVRTVSETPICTLSAHGHSL